MRDRIAVLANEIRSSYHSLHDHASQIRSKDPSIAIATDKKLLNLSVCAIDGGLLYQRVHGADIIVTRSVGVNFVYSNSSLSSFAYFPAKSPQPEIELKSSLDEHESQQFSSLLRLKSELECAVASMQKFSPQLLLMDGSLLPLPSDRPPESSELHGRYAQVIALYQKLYSECNERKCMLCGVIKDSRSRKLSDDLGIKCSDSLLCNYLLQAGERTKEFAYSESKNKDAISLGSNIKVFYLKSSPNDLPLRIEVLDNAAGNVANAATLLYSLSAISDNFAYPAILVEADMCAALDPKEIEYIEQSLITLSGLKPLRRNNRPFR